MKVTQFSNNHFIVSDEEGNLFFQSYEKVILKKTREGKIFLDPYFWDYSKTTSRNRQLFLQETRKETLGKIQIGLYEFKCLN